MDIAKSVQEAMGLLTKAEAEIEPEVLDEPAAPDGSEDVTSETKAAVDTASGEEPASAEKGAAKIDIVKGADTSGLEEYIQADDFLKGLVDVVDQNTSRLAKAVEVQNTVSGKVLDVLKGMTEVLGDLQKKVSDIGATPVSRKSAITKAEAQATVVDNPALSDTPTLSKSTLIQALTKAVGEGKAQVRDVTILESLGGGSFSQEIPMESVFERLSPSGQQIVRSLVEGR